MNEYGIGRREVMGGIAALALLPMAAFGALATPASARAPISAPLGPMVLRRVLRRDLGDGAAIVVTRDWRCRFDDLGAGLGVTGEQVFVDVSAPASLGPLAQIEQRRDVTELFPLKLDRAGLIVPGEPTGASSPGVARAVEIASALLASLPQAAARRDARQFLAEIHATAARLVSRVPVDLFFPEPGERVVERPVALANGAEGIVEVMTAARAQPATGLLEASERRIVTRLEGSERVSCECWTLGSA